MLSQRHKATKSILHKFFSVAFPRTADPLFVECLCERNFYAVRLFLICCSLFAGNAPAEQPQLRAGAAKLLITPQVQVPLYGYGNRTGGDGVHDDIYVRTLVLSDGDDTIAMIATDICEYQQDFFDYALPRVCEETGIARDHLMFTSTHTHAGPVISLRENQPAHVRENSEWTLQQIIKCVREAQQAMRPARIGYGRGEAWVAFNRRARGVNGDIVIGINPQWAVDREVGVIRMDGTNGTPIAAAINFAVHGTVMGGKNLMVSGDLPGAAERYVETAIGQGVIAPFYNGCSGDNNPIYHGLEKFDTKIGELEILGRILGEEVVRVYQSLTLSDRASITAAADDFEIPGKPFGQTWPSEPGPPRKMNLTAFKINNLVIGSISGEVFAEIGMKIKAASPFKSTFVFSLTNGAWHYIPTAEAFNEGGYEVKSSTNTPEGEAIIIERMEQLFWKL